jgi:hypothetical protein
MGVSEATAASAEASVPAATVEPDVPPERRSGPRLSRDNLIHDLRDPDPRVRAQAFAKLKDIEP